MTEAAESRPAADVRIVVFQRVAPNRFELRIDAEEPLAMTRADARAFAALIEAEIGSGLMRTLAPQPSPR